jgi:GNAT superfamily N-acetyltransferase
MQITKSSFEKIKILRESYLSSLPEFQELFLELMISDAHCYLIKNENTVQGYAIMNSDGVLIEFYVKDLYVPVSHEVFNQLIKELAIHEVYCKSFDSLLLNACMQSSLPYSLVGVLYRDYSEPQIQNDPDILMRICGLASVNLLLNQDESIKELFETEQQLRSFIEHEHVFEFYKNDNLIGCGMVIRTKAEWDFCDLGVWVHPQRRGNGMGAQIILQLRAFALQNQLSPSCGCGIENIASQKTIEKSGFVSKHKLICFMVE